MSGNSDAKESKTEFDLEGFKGWRNESEVSSSDASSSERRKVEKVWHSHKDHREHDQ